MPGGLGPTDLDDIAHDLLQAGVDSLNAIPTFAADLEGAPTRAFVSPTEPVWDCCEMLVVNADGVTQASTRPVSPPQAPGMRHRLGAWLWEVRLVLTIGRCVPEGSIQGTQYVPPSTTELEASAAQINADGWALANGIANRLYQGLLSDKCSSWKWDGVNPAAPMGGCAGWVINFRAQLDGYGATDDLGS